MHMHMHSLSVASRCSAWWERSSSESWARSHVLAATTIMDGSPQPKLKKLNSALTATAATRCRWRLDCVRRLWGAEGKGRSDCDGELLLVGGTWRPAERWVGWLISHGATQHASRARHVSRYTVSHHETSPSRRVHAVNAKPEPSTHASRLPTRATQRHTTPQITPCRAAPLIGTELPALRKRS